MIGYFRHRMVVRAQQAVNKLVTSQMIGKISDGYHSFDELYEHRAAIFIALCRKIATIHSRSVMNQNPGVSVWRSWAHADGTTINGWFVLGIGTEAGKQVSYHLPKKYWEKCDFATALPMVPSFDGHTSEDVITRLMEIEF